MLKLGRDEEAPAAIAVPSSEPTRFQEYEGPAQERMYRGDWEPALALWDELLERFPDHWPALAGRGDALLELGRVEDAETVFAALKSRQPHRPQGHEGLARKRMYRGDWQPALALWDELLERFPDHWPALAGRGHALLQLGRVADASRVFAALKSRQPSRPQGEEGLAQSDMHRGDWEPALARWDEILRRFPWHWPALAGRGDALLQLGRVADAARVSAVLRHREPHRTQGYEGLARTDVHRGEWEAALSRWDEILDRFPWHWPALAGRGHALLQLGHIADASRVFAALKHRQPHHPQGYEGLAQSDMHRGEWQAALARWDEILERFPWHWPALAGRGDALLQLGCLADASSVFAALKIREPKRPDGYEGLAWAAMHRHDWEPALALWDDLLARFPDHWPARFGRANALLQLERFAEATAIFAALRNQRPGQPQGYEGLALSAMHCRDWEPALARWDDLLARFHQRPQDLVRRGQTLIHLGRHAEARAEFETVVRSGAAVQAGEEGLARCLELSRGPGAAASVWEEVVRAWPRSLEARWGWARTLTWLNRYDEALAVIEEASRRFPDEVSLHNHAVWLEMHRQATPERGLKRLEAAWRLRDHPSYRLLELRFHTFIHQALPPNLEDLIADVLASGNQDVVLALIHLLLVVGVRDRAETLLEGLVRRLPRGDRRFRGHALRALVSIFYDGDLERGLAEVRSLSPAWRRANNVALPRRYPRPVPRRRPGGAQRILVLVHVFYGDMLPDLMTAISRLPRERCEVRVSLSEKLPDLRKCRQLVRSGLENVQILVTENRGFDIGAYWQLLQGVDLREYDLLLFVHSKKAGHALETGALWKRHLLEGLLKSRDVAEENLALMAADPRVVCLGSLSPLPLSWFADHEFKNYFEVQHRVAGRRFARGPAVYVPGTMILARAGYIRDIYARLQGLPFEDYETLSFAGRYSGTYAHATEILFGSYAVHRGARPWYLRDPDRLVLRLP